MLAMLTAALAQAVDPTGVAYIPPSLVTERSPCGAAAGSASRPVVSTFERDWYAGQWRAAGEPSLAQAGGETLRFTWLRSFHRPVFVRVEGLSSARPRLIARELTGRGGYAPGAVARVVDRPLGKDEAIRLRAMLARFSLRDEAPVQCDVMGMDGAQWIVETRDQSGYRPIVRWSPGAGAVRVVGLALLALTGWDVGEVY